MNHISLDAAAEYLAANKHIQKLQDFNKADHPYEARFAITAADANAFVDELPLYRLITEKMSLTAKRVPRRITVMEPDALRKELAFVIEGAYDFTAPNTPKILYHAFASYDLDDAHGRHMSNMDDLTPRTFNAGLFIFGYKKVSPDKGFTYALGFSGADED